MEEMGAAYIAEGLVTLAGSRIYTSMADTDEVIDDALDRFDRVFSKMKKIMDIAEARVKVCQSGKRLLQEGLVAAHGAM
jgi:hypothetical protein